MPIVFVHGVNNRTEDANYDEGVERKKAFFQSLLAEPLGLNPQKLSISFPYWGGEGVKFRWNQASVPSGTDKVEVFGLSTPGSVDESMVIWQGEARYQYGSEGVSLGQLSREKGFETAVDLFWDTAASVLRAEQGYDELLDGYLASLKYAAEHPVPGWAFQQPALSNSEFVGKLMDEIKPYRDLAQHGRSTEALGIGNWFQTAKEAASRLADAPGDGLSSIVLALARKSAHAKASRFLGDVFVYLDKRGIEEQPGAIVGDVIAKLRAAQAAKQAGDEKLIVIGHSLGGVIVYDVLTHFAPDIKVDVLVTVGSQVALFEEMALYRASDANPPANPSVDRLERPRNVARWLNVYDTNDVFSFQAATVFNGVDDYRFDTGYGLLDAHGGYFARPSFYKRLTVRLRKDA